MEKFKIPSDAPESVINNYIALTTLKQFPHEKDRSDENIYATTLLDGRRVWIKGASANMFIVDGVVQMRGTCVLTDGTVCPITIRTDSNGDNVKIDSLLKEMICPHGVSEAEWKEKLALGSLQDAPDELYENIGVLADKFLAGIKPIIAYRKAIKRSVQESITSSPAPESQE